MDLSTRLPPIPEKRINQAHSPSMSSTSEDRVQTENKSSPKVAPRRNIPRADFVMLVGELEGINQSQGLIHRSSHWEVIHCEAPNLALWVYDEDIPENTLTFVNLDLKKSSEPNFEVVELLNQPEGNSSHGNTFRSPFDPRSEDLLSSSREDELGDYGNLPGKLKHRRRHSEWSEGRKGGEPLLEEVEPIMENERSDVLNAYDEEEENLGPQPIPRRRKYSGGDVRSVSDGREMNALQEFEEEDDDLEDSWADEESRLRPPALPINLESALAELPVEDPATRTKRLRSLQFPLYVSVGGDQDGAIYNRNKDFADTRPLRTMDQNIPEGELPDTLVIRTRRRTMSGVTGFLPRSSTLSSSSIWFGDHPVPSKTQIFAADNSPLRLSSIQLQAQAEIARRRSRNNLAARSVLSAAGGLGRSRSLERSRATFAASTGALYGPTGRRIHGGAPLVERAIKRHTSHRDGYETLSLVHVPKLDGDETSSTIVAAANAAEQRRLRRPASSASIYKLRTGHAPSQIDIRRNRDEARSLIAQAAVDLAVHTYDLSEV